MPDYYNNDTKILTNNPTINIAILGFIPDIKGIYFYEKLMKYIESNGLKHKYNLKIFVSLL